VLALFSTGAAGVGYYLLRREKSQQIPQFQGLLPMLDPWGRRYAAKDVIISLAKGDIRGVGSAIWGQIKHEWDELWKPRDISNIPFLSDALRWIGGNDIGNAILYYGLGIQVDKTTGNITVSIGDALLDIVALIPLAGWAARGIGTLSRLGATGLRVGSTAVRTGRLFKIGTTLRGSMKLGNLAKYKELKKFTARMAKKYGIDVPKLQIKRVPGAGWSAEFNLEKNKITVNRLYAESVKYPKVPIIHEIIERVLVEYPKKLFPRISKSTEFEVSLANRESFDAIKTKKLRDMLTDFVSVTRHKWAAEAYRNPAMYRALAEKYEFVIDRPRAFCWHVYNYVKNILGDHELAETVKSQILRTKHWAPSLVPVLPNLINNKIPSKNSSSETTNVVNRILRPSSNNTKNSGNTNRISNISSNSRHSIGLIAKNTITTAAKVVKNFGGNVINAIGNMSRTFEKAFSSLFSGKSAARK
jgi:hypothetical protein